MYEYNIFFAVVLRHWLEKIISPSMFEHSPRNEDEWETLKQTTLESLILEFIKIQPTTNRFITLPVNNENLAETNLQIAFIFANNCGSVKLTIGIGSFTKTGFRHGMVLFEAKANSSNILELSGLIFPDTLTEIEKKFETEVKSWNKESNTPPSNSLSLFPTRYGRFEDFMVIFYGFRHGMCQNFAPISQRSLTAKA